MENNPYAEEETISNSNFRYGMYTGLFLARDVRKAYPSVPIILFSFASFPDLRESASRLASKLSNCVFLPKAETMPNDLIDVVNRYFEEFELRPKRRRSILSRLFSSLLLQPNLSGIGVDLKKLSEDE